jgi:undecaprenyl-diphosphatase
VLQDPPSTAARATRLTVRLVPRALVAWVALALVAVPFGLLLLLVRGSWPPLLALDDGVRDGLHTYAVGHPAFVTGMKAISVVGSTAVLFPVFAVVTVALLWRRRVRLAIFVLVAIGGDVLLNSAVKALVARARPVLPDPVEHAAGYSFPSGHAQAAAVTYLVLLLLVLPVARGALRAASVVVAVLMVAAIGFSRLALGVHFLTDVTAGYLLGAAWVTVLVTLFRVSFRAPAERSP